MSTNLENERFQELVTELFSLLQTFESEIVNYRAAYKHLRFHSTDQGLSADLFQQSLDAARRDQIIRKSVDEKYKTELQQFDGLSHLPIGPKMQLLRELIQDIRSGDPRFYPSGDAPLKDAQ